jgi:protein BTG2
MKVEIESAANFLQNLLRLHSSDLIVDRLEVFREALSNALTLHYKEHWFPERPFKGSGYRCLRINHKMDPVITKAGLTCGLGNNKFYSLK